MIASRVRLQSAGIAAVIVGLLFAGCSRSGQATRPATPTPGVPAPERYAARGAFGVGAMTVELVDGTRATEANRDAPGSAERRMAIEVWYPGAPAVAAPEERDAPLERTGAPFPLIIFAHGYSSFRRQSASYAQHLASHGYVVAAPDFPQSHIGAPGGARIWAVLDQPGDVSFVIDELLTRDGEPGWPLAGAIDAERIGLTGHSLGGLTTLLTAFGEDRDARVRAILPISPVGCLLPATLTSPSPLPVMVVGGSREAIVNPASIMAAYRAVPPPRYYVEIIGADHVRFADIDTTDEELGDIVANTARGDLAADALRVAQEVQGDAASCLQRTESSDGLVAGERQRELLRTVATPFFDAYLKGDADALLFLLQSLPVLDGVRVTSDVE